MVFHKDPCGIFCVIFTYVLIFYADYVIIQHIVLTSLAGSLWGPIHAFLFNMILLALLFAHTQSMFADPGIVPLPIKGLDFSDVRITSKDQSSSEHDWTVCQRCESYRPPRAHHCKICRRCIRRMDHHCPWVNNCIGELNQKYFIQFLFYTGVLCVYALALDISSWVWMFGSHRTNNADILSRKSTLAHGIGLCIESVLFGIFVIVMIYDQISSIFVDETGVEYTIHRSRKQKAPWPRKPKILLLREVFGFGPIYTWFIPCSINRNRAILLPGHYNV